MSRFKCECLNVTLHAKEKSVRKVNGQDFVTDAVGFFAGEICEVDLAVAGITKVRRYAVIVVAGVLASFRQFRWII